MARSRPSPWVVLAIVIGGVYAALAIVWVTQQPPSVGADSVQLRRAGERLLAGEALYRDPEGVAFLAGGLDLYYGPPALALAVGVPLSLVGEPLVRLLTFPIVWSVSVLTTLGVGRALSLSWEELAALFVGLCLCFALFATATLGATSLIVLLGGMVGLLAVARGHDRALGIAIGLMGALRVYPLALLLPLLLAGRWSTTRWALVTAGLTSLAALAVTGVETYETYAHLLAALVGTDTGSSNLALTGFLRPATIVGASVLLLISAWQLRHSSAHTRTIAWGLGLAGMLWSPPVVWDHYLTALLPLMLALIVATGRASFGLLPALLAPSAWFAGVVLYGFPIVVATAHLTGFLGVPRQTPTGLTPRRGSS
ncbi:MAG TPA: glycosyltransferase 87 family protein [Candidatus Limnocylindrales bacterium]|nr:glycosyltransferase 87 family protein [Candidatus Limnocylindrales bacterium]